ncbi:E3 ubiquitin-protein ligase RNF126-like [Artemia franciscana]
MSDPFETNSGSSSSSETESDRSDSLDTGSESLTTVNVTEEPDSLETGSESLDSSGMDSDGSDSSDFESLVSVNITEEQVKKSSECSVCLDDYKLQESVKKLPCSHLFHKDCIIPWLRLHSTCPVCRES